MSHGERPLLKQLFRIRAPSRSFCDALMPGPKLLRFDKILPLMRMPHSAKTWHWSGFDRHMASKAWKVQGSYRTHKRKSRPCVDLAAPSEAECFPTRYRSETTRLDNLKFSITVCRMCSIAVKIRSCLKNTGFAKSLLLQSVIIARSLLQRRCI